MKIIGLTGNIASGKSATSSFLRKLGAEVIDVDEIGKKIQDNNFKDVVKQIRDAFGEEVIKDNKIDRKVLGAKVFSDKDELKKLNSIMVPLMSEKLNWAIENCREKKVEVLIVDAAILFEGGWDKLVDFVWVVYVPRDIQLSRLMTREHIDSKEALARIDSQIDISEKIKKADVVINNSGNLEEVEENIVELWKKLNSI
jgi:dephospho-CoA kinase